MLANEIRNGQARREPKVCRNYISHISNKSSNRATQKKWTELPLMLLSYLTLIFTLSSQRQITNLASEEVTFALQSSSIMLGSTSQPLLYSILISLSTFAFNRRKRIIHMLVMTFNLLIFIVTLVKLWFRQRDPSCFFMHSLSRIACDSLGVGSRSNDCKIVTSVNITIDVSW